MRFIYKINFKKFTPLSLVTLVLFCLFSKGQNETLVILAVYLATLGNLFMLTEGVIELTQEQANKEKVVYLFIGKVLLLILALTLGVQIIGNRIIIPILNYIMQIFILVLSLKRS